MVSLPFIHHYARCLPRFNLSRVLSQKHCADHHLHLINTFPQVTMNTFNQDAQDKRESQHDISLKECSHLEFHFSLIVHIKRDVSVSLERLTPWKNED